MHSANLNRSYKMFPPELQKITESSYKFQKATASLELYPSERKDYILQVAVDVPST
jgi:hypothetical protein